MSSKTKLLYIHIPKTAGVYLSEYINHNLPYRQVLSDKRNDANVWTDFTVDELMGYLHEEEIFLPTHTLSYGWHDLAYIIPWASQEQIIDTIRLFKANGWFTFAFVRHPGDILCSFYHYVYDFHQQSMPHVVAAHAPVIDRSLDAFVAEHCEKPLLPSYWHELDVVAEASDKNFTAFFKRYFQHDFQPGTAPSHASGSRGYRYYCAEGVISQATQRKVEQSVNMQIYQQILQSTQM
ncbi:MAG: hypothetical protein R3C14_54705 [Caldilineaceae bacterium]